MKKIHLHNAVLFLTAVSLAGLASSCSKEYLSPDVTEYVTEAKLQEMKKDPALLSDLVTASMSGAYKTMIDYDQSHDDFGLKAFHIATDVMTEDMPIAINWFRFDYMYDNFGATYRRTNSEWRQFYKVISTCNIVLRDYFGEESKDPAVLSAKAEPLALRGIMYFHLVNFYQVTYKGNENALGVPLALKPEDEKLARSPLKDVYTQIIKDLTFAVENGTVTEGHADADKGVAAAYLAKVYAQMEDWKNVEKYAAIAEESASDATPGFPMSWNIGNSDVLWGFDMNGTTTTYWASFYSHMDNTLKNYAGNGQYKKIYNWLYWKMGKNDSRRKLWINNAEFPDIAKAVGHENYTEIQKDENGKDIEVEHNFDYETVKFKAPDGLNTDYIFIRVQDPILLKIEAINEQGRTAEAAKLLNEFMQKRDPDFMAKGDQAGLREQIRINRRIELWGEGTTWFDMKRWKVLVDRTKDAVLPDGTIEGSNHNKVGLFIKDLNDIKNIQKLPQDEVNNNKNLVQN